MSESKTKLSSSEGTDAPDDDISEETLLQIQRAIEEQAKSLENAKER